MTRWWLSRQIRWSFSSQSGSFLGREEAGRTPDCRVSVAQPPGIQPSVRCGRWEGSIISVAQTARPLHGGSPTPATLEIHQLWRSWGLVPKSHRISVPESRDLTWALCSQRGVQTTEPPRSSQGIDHLGMWFSFPHSRYLRKPVTCVYRASAQVQARSIFLHY